MPQFQKQLKLTGDKQITREIRDYVNHQFSMNHCIKVSVTSTY